MLKQLCVLGDLSGENSYYLVVVSWMDWRTASVYR